MASDRQIEYAPKLKNNIFDLVGWINPDKSNTVKRQLAWLENSSCCEELRKTDSFNAMIDKYKPFATDS
jgi:hypothetical protein